ncbi:unnamed protein product [Diamesa serratosioi]
MSNQLGNSEYSLRDHTYGKVCVKLLNVVQNGRVHSIKEIKIATNITLESIKDYVLGDNSDIIDTDSQKNAIFLFAKKYGISTIEDFGVLLCKHFLSQYNHVLKANVSVEELQWERISYGENAIQKLHNHAFIHTPVATRVCTVTWNRQEEYPVITSGIKDLRVIKTAHSSFVNFIDDEYRTLADQPDRIFGTIVDASWKYSANSQIDFDKAWKDVKYCILRNFAGDLDIGVASPSLQNTIYRAEKSALDTVSEISEIEMTMPNKTYANVDFSKFPSLVDGQSKSKETVFIPIDDPSSLVHGKLVRNDSKL